MGIRKLRELLKTKGRYLFGDPLGRGFYGPQAGKRSAKPWFNFSLNLGIHYQYLKQGKSVF